MKTLVTLCIVLLIVSCKNSSPEAKTDITELEKKISIETHPRKALYTIVTVGKERSIMPGPTDYELVAILDFSKESLKNLKEEISKCERRSSRISIKELNYGTEINKVLRPYFKFEKDRSATIKATVYRAEPFFKNSFNNGICFFTTTDKLVLMLYTD